MSSSTSAGVKKNIRSIGVIRYCKSLYEADYLPKGTSSIDFINKMHFGISSC